MGRGHGLARGRGVGRGQARTFAFHDAVDECEEATFGWDDDDNVSGQPPHFHPNGPAGLNLPPGFATQCELDFFTCIFLLVLSAVWQTQPTCMHGSTLLIVQLMGTG